MKLQNKDDLPVYEAEIMRSATAADEGHQIIPAKSQNLIKATSGTPGNMIEDYPKPVPAQAGTPQKNLAYRVGKAVGSLVVVTGLYREIRAIFRTGKPGGAGMGLGRGPGMGKGRAQEKGRRRNRNMRRII